MGEAQYSKGHKYLTLVYQIDLGWRRLLMCFQLLHQWIGKERTVKTFKELGTAIVNVESAATLCTQYGAPEILPIGTASSIAEARQVIASDQAWTLLPPRKADSIHRIMLGSVSHRRIG